MVSSLPYPEYDIVWLFSHLTFNARNSFIILLFSSPQSNTQIIHFAKILSSFSYMLIFPPCSLTLLFKENIFKRQFKSSIQEKYIHYFIIYFVFSSKGATGLWNLFMSDAFLCPPCGYAVISLKSGMIWQVILCKFSKWQGSTLL